MSISFTQSAYSTPTKKTSMFDTMTITLGPPPNSTDISLDTTITIDTVATATLNNLQITPQTPISHMESVTSGSLTYDNIIYPAQQLEPATAYTISVNILDVPVTWTFTTTSDPLDPGFGFYLVKNNVGISLTVAVLNTLVLGLLIWFKKGKVITN